MRAGYDVPELHPAQPDLGADNDRHEPDRCAGPRPATARDPGARSRREPLGVLRANFSVPPETPGPKAREQKKSFRWIEGLCAEVASHLSWTERPPRPVRPTARTRPGGRPAGTREAQSRPRRGGRRRGRPGRAPVRQIARGPVAAAAPSMFRGKAHARRPASNAASPNASRQAELTLRYERVTLPRPGDKPIALWMMHAREQCPPPNTRWSGSCSPPCP